MPAKTLFDGGATSKLWLDRRDFYPTPQQVAELWTNVTPFTTVLGQLGSMKVGEPVYKLFEHESSFVNREFTITTALTVASTDTESAAITVGTITGLPATVSDSWKGLECDVWDSTKTTKRGVVIITSALSTTTIGVKTLKAAALTTVSGDVLVVHARDRGEGSVSSSAESDELKVVWNSAAFMSDSAEVTGALYYNAKLRGYSNEFARLREEMFKRYKTYREGAMLKQVSTLGTNMNGSDTFSEASLKTITDSTGASGAIRTTYGFIPILEDYGITWTGTGDINLDTNVFSLSADSVDYAMWVAMAEAIFDKREDQRAMVFAGRGAITKLHQKIMNDSKKMGWLGKVQIGDAQWNKLGFFMSELETPHGVFYLVPTRSLRYEYNNYMAIPHLEHCGIAEYVPVEYKNDVKKDNDYDGVKDVIKSFEGFHMTLLKSHQLIKFTA